MNQMHIISCDSDEFTLNTILLASKFAKINIECTNKCDGKQSCCKSGYDSISKAPYLKTNEGLIFGSVAILEYFADYTPMLGLNGVEKFDKYVVMSVVSSCINDLEVPLLAILKNPNIKDVATVDVCKYIESIDKLLFSQTYLVCNRITIADITFYATMLSALPYIDISKYPNVNRFMENIKNQPETLSTNLKVTQKPIVVPESCQNACSEPTLVLDDWKRKYSNSTCLETDMEWFWNVFYCKTKFTIYHMRYDKLENECKIDYLTSNLMAGFIQRLAPDTRKKLFGVFHIFGCEDNYDYEGVFLIPGNTLPEGILDHPSFEFHPFKKLDTDDLTIRKFIYEFWCRKDTVNSRPIFESVYYK